MMTNAVIDTRLIIMITPTKTICIIIGSNRMECLSQFMLPP